MTLHSQPRDLPPTTIVTVRRIPVRRTGDTCRATLMGGPRRHARGIMARGVVMTGNGVQTRRSIRCVGWIVGDAVPI